MPWRKLLITCFFIFLGLLVFLFVENQKRSAASASGWLPHIPPISLSNLTKTLSLPLSRPLAPVIDTQPVLPTVTPTAVPNPPVTSLPEAGVSGQPQATPARDVNSDSSRGTGGINITLTDAQVNEALALIPKETLPITSARISFGEGTVTLSGKISRPISGDLKVEAYISVVDQRRLSLKIKSTSINGAPVPTFLLPSFDGPVNDLLTAKFQNYVDYRIESLTISPGRLTVSLSSSVKSF